VSGTVSCVDTKGNSYTVDTDVMNGTSGSGDGVRTVILSAPITTALVSGNTITVTHPSVSARAVSVNEFSGLISSGRLDRFASATGSSASPSSGTTVSTLQPIELILGAVGVEAKNE